MYHTAEMLDALARRAPEVLPCLTCCAIDDPGTDTTNAVTRALERFPAVRIAACVAAEALPAELADRLVPLVPARLAELTSFAKLVSSLLRPGGILVQDVHLSTLRFISPDRWWDSIYVAATVRGTFARRPPAVRFLSNKRGYTATFGRDLLDAGFDPREVMDKAELEEVVVPSIARDLRSRFPLQLLTEGRGVPVAGDEDARREIDEQLDVVLWSVAGRSELSGRAVPASVTFRAGSHEARTWHDLIVDRVSGGGGVLIADVGQRLADAGAERAEMSNLAARHVHALRARLDNGQALQTANHAYRLDPSLTVGLVRARDDAHLR